MSEIIHKIEFTPTQAETVRNMNIDINWNKIIDLFNLEKMEICINYPNEISFSVVKDQINDTKNLKQPDILILRSNVSVDYKKDNVEVWIVNKKTGISAFAFPQQELSQKTGSTLVMLFAKTLYLMRFGKDLFEVEEKTIKINANKKKRKSKKCFMKTKHYKCYKIINCAEIQRKLSKKHKITCNLWEVAGHLRRYKSGKVVYIKPYKKGRDKYNDTVIVKQHEVLPRCIKIGGVTLE